ncbi:hypothetical protein SteCoe_38453 [Stentor coeruleus]|uniref:Uncharacterized protein n=1 Tax=Stentor coeruleus TaxID=5963 RepID=A0A1R2ALH1_9CILI|nr:hypothetical protein SteCoe_38453 [Stentor coeruleus]
MGCCQNRDDSKIVLNHPEQYTKSLSTEINLDCISQDSLFFSSSTSDLNESAENSENSEKLLLMYLQSLNQRKKWEQLAPMMTNRTEVKSPNVFIPWAEKPKTIGSVALVYMGLAVKKFTTQVAPYIEVFLPVIVIFIKSGSKDLKDNALFLLHYYVDYASEKAINKILTMDTFSFLTKWILAPNNYLRTFTVILCYKLYKDRPNAKKDFIKVNGGFMLIQLIGWYSDNDSLGQFLSYLEELVTENCETIIKDNIEMTSEPLTINILKGINPCTKPIETKVLLEKMVRIYS